MYSLKNWYIDTKRDRIVGHVFGRQGFEDGELIVTSKITDFYYNRGYFEAVTGSKSVYILKFENINRTEPMYSATMENLMWRVGIDSAALDMVNEMSSVKMANTCRFLDRSLPTGSLYVETMGKNPIKAIYKNYMGYYESVSIESHRVNGVKTIYISNGKNVDFRFRLSGNKLIPYYVSNKLAGVAFINKGRVVGFTLQNKVMALQPEQYVYVSNAINRNVTYR